MKIQNTMRSRRARAAARTTKATSRITPTESDNESIKQQLEAMQMTWAQLDERRDSEMKKLKEALPKHKKRRRKRSATSSQR